MMRDNEAMPAREAMRGNRGVSHRSSNAALCAARGAIGRQLLVFFQNIGYTCGVLFHATLIIKAERAVLETRRAPSRQMEAQMTTCNNCINDTPDSQNWESGIPKNGYVYLIKPVGHNVYKIGCSVDPERRLKTLQGRVKGVRLEIVAVIPYQHHTNAERQWQATYSRYCLFGEWFALPESEVERFKALAVQS